MDIKSVLPLLAVSLVMSLLYSASKKNPQKDDAGNIILQLPKLYPILGILVMISGVGLLIFAVFFASDNDQIPAILSSFIALFAGFLLFAKGYISSIKITDRGIMETTMFWQKKEILWGEINDLSFGKVSLELKICSPNNKIKAHMHLIGFQDFLVEIERYTGKTKAELGIPD